MRSTRGALVVLILTTCAGCGAAAPAPTNRVASSEAAIRGAREVGAESVPSASLYLKLSEEQVTRAKAAMAIDENERADLLLQRAQADAELAIALTRETTAGVEAKQTTDQLDQARSKK